MLEEARKAAQASLTGIGLVLLASVGFSARGVLVKLAYPYGVDAVTLMTLRMMFSLPFFVVMAAVAKRRAEPLTRSDWHVVLGLGFIGYYLSSYLSFLGLLYIPAALERLLLYLTPTLVVLISALFFKQRVRRHHAIALAVTYGGIVLVMGDSLVLAADPHALIAGSMLAITSALTYSAYLIGSGIIIPRIGSARFTAYASGTACLIVIAQFFLVRDLATLDLPLPVYVYGAMMAIICTVLPTWLMAEGMRRIGTNQASIVSSIGPVSTIVLAALVLNEAITVVQVAGAALVLTGVWLVGRKREPEPYAATAPSADVAKETR
ncbi:MAG: DMT family transporter [Burkholderiales bacterium]|nr:DMT family transporter [Burkholderiales bacterium]